MTWGISGPTFLGLYAVALVIVIVGTQVLRRRLMRPGGGSAMVATNPSSPLTVDELAYLSGGLYGLGASALVGLRERGEVSSPNRRQVKAEHMKLDAAATPAQRALHSELKQIGSYPVRRLGTLIGRTPVPAAIRSSLAGRGLITDRALRTKLRLCTLGYEVLLGVGVVRVVAGVHNHKSVADLLVLMAITAGAALLALRVPQVTPAGRDAARVANGLRCFTHREPARRSRARRRLVRHRCTVAGRARDGRRARFRPGTSDFQR